MRGKAGSAWILGLTFLLLHSFLQAGSSLRFQNISIQDGLSQSIVECILQDREGFLWFGTEDGLNRYDGYQFTVFKEDPSNPNSLSHDNILCLLQDGNGFIWIGTFHGGLNRYDPRNGQFTRFRHDPTRPDSLAHDVVNSLALDRQGTMWVGTAGGLDAWNPDTQGFVHADERGEAWNPLAVVQIASLCIDRDGRMWVGTLGSGVFRSDAAGSPPIAVGEQHMAIANVMSICDDGAGRIWIGTRRIGAFRWDSATDTFFHFDYRPGPGKGLRSPNVRSILLDRSGTIWLGTDNGLHRFNEKDESFIVYTSISGDIRSIAHNEIHCVFEDRAEVLWAGTYGGGVSKSIGRKNHFIHFHSNAEDPDTLGNNIVWSFYEDQAGILWVGTHGGGLERLDRKTHRFTRYRHRPGDPSSLSDNRVRVVMRTRDGFFWLGTNNGGINRFDPETETFITYRNNPGDPASIGSDTVRCILEDTFGNLWVGTIGGGLNRMDRESGRFTRYMPRVGDTQSVSNNVIRVLYESPPGVLWIGTYGGGLDRLDIRSGRFTHIRAQPENPDALSNDYVFSIHEDRNGHFWVGTEGGLNQLNPATGKWSRYGIQEGLQANTVYGIVEDNDGRLWLSTSKGLSRFDPKTKKFRNFHYIDGLQDDEFNGGAYYRNRRGELFFGGINGFNIIDPSMIEDNNHMPPVVITDFRKFNQTVNLGAPMHTLRRVVLSHGDSMITFGFAALDFTVPEKNRYAYRMEGLTNKWIHTEADQRYATFTSLPPGSYRFRVKGSNNQGVWNQAGATVDVRVLPPWWKIWWLQWGAGLLLLVLSGIMFRRRMRAVLRKTRMSTELTAAHDAQMSIMPQHNPGIAGLDVEGLCVPASEVGGDFYDFLWSGEGESDFGVVVGDVSGKGMKAAMTAVMANGIIFSTAEAHRSIAKIMECLNESLCRKTDRRDFVALMIAAFGKERREMRFINCGLPIPLLKRGDSVRELKSDGSRFPPGICMGKKFSESRFSLLPGDVVMFMTDGITEAMNCDLELFGEDRLSAHLRSMDTERMTAHEILEAVGQRVNGFMGEATARDDMTLVVVKVS